VRGQRLRPRRRPEALLGDRAFDRDPHREQLRRRGIRPLLARRRTEHGRGLGGFRWVAERFHAWVNHFGRLRVRTGRTAEPYEAFLTPACGPICLSLI
jgi:transposase